MTTCEGWILLSVGLAAASGLPALAIPSRFNLGQRLATLLLCTGCVAGLIGAAGFFLGRPTAVVSWPAPLAGARFAVGVDGLSAVFLVPVFLLCGAGSLYGLAYWPVAEHPENGRRLVFFFGTLTAALALLACARDWVLFLFAWEAMALSAFFLVGTEDRLPKTQATAWLYLAASHTATLALFVMVAAIWAATGSFALGPLDGVAPWTLTAVFCLGLVGFGTKAGLAPLHFWLPSSHAMAPSHVSAVMSGVIIKLGIYGLIRLTSLVTVPPAWWGGALLAIGAISAVGGIAFAVGQHDLKRLLAYSSVENVGVIALGLGLALWGRSHGRVELVALGLGAALAHVWAHAAFKGALFLASGCVLHACGTRRMDELGGLAQRMPRVAAGFFAAAATACALPPCGAFASEFLLYLGLVEPLRKGGDSTGPALALLAPLVALVGTLAVVAFVKAFGTVFLGLGRTSRATAAHEPPFMMWAPVLALAGLGVGLGLAAEALAPALDRAIAAWAGPALEPPPLTTLAPLGLLVRLGGCLLMGCAMVGLLMAWWIRRGPVGATVTWDCGYAAPAPRMQYTSSSLAEMLVGLLGWVLRPRELRPRLTGPFPATGRLRTNVRDVVLQEAVRPAVSAAAWGFGWFRVFQQGSIQAYLLYVFLTLVVLLLWR